jgi:hypothetical protein
MIAFSTTALPFARLAGKEKLDRASYPGVDDDRMSATIVPAVDHSRRGPDARISTIVIFCSRVTDYSRKTSFGTFF